MPEVADEPLNADAAWAAVRQRWRWLPAAAAAGLVLGVGWTVLRPPVYVATSDVMFQNDPKDPKRADTEVRIASSRAVLDQAAATLPGGGDGASLANSVAATKLTQDVIRLTAWASSAARARQVAEAYTTQYVDYSGGILRQGAADSATGLTRQLDPVNAQLAEVSARINGLDADPRLNATGPSGDAARLEQVSLQKSQDRLGQDITDLQGKIAESQVAAGAHNYFTRINQPVPLAPALGDRLRRIAGTTLLLPMLTAAGIVVARRRDNRLHRPEPVARAAGAPVLAEVGVPAGIANLRDGHGGRPLDESEALRYRRAAARVAGASTSSLTLVRPAGDRAAQWAVEHLTELLPADSPRVRHVVADGVALSDFDPGTRVVLVVPAGTLSAAALHLMAGSCHDAGAAPHGILFVTPDRAPRPVPPRLLRRTEPAGSAATG